jgi:glycosyltransferase involved in cell wall biosynthesis
VKKTKNIILLAKNIDGGTGDFFQRIINHSDSLFQQNPTFALVLEKPAYREFTEAIETRYFKNSSFYPEKFTFSLRTFSMLFYEYVWVSKNLTSINPTVIFTVDTHCALLAEIYKKLINKNIVLIHSLHNNVNDTLREKTDKLTEKLIIFLIGYLFKKSDYLVCVSKELALDLQNRFKLDKLPRIINYGIDVPNLQKSKSVKKKIIMSIGRFVEQKDFPTLIKAFALLKPSKRNIELWLLGDGNLLNQYKLLASKLNISKNVKFLGWKKNPYKYLIKAYIFALASHREGFPIVILEALKYGIPVVATNCRFGPQEILENGKYGRLIQPGNINDFADSLTKLLSNRRYFNKMKKVSQIRGAYYSETKMISEYSQLISSVLQ